MPQRAPSASVPSLRMHVHACVLLLACSVRPLLAKRACRSDPRRCSFLAAFRLPGNRSLAWQTQRTA
eukprot:363256-Chlamydomonas_euryale.AAC.4